MAASQENEALLSTDTAEPASDIPSSPRTASSRRSHPKHTLPSHVSRRVLVISILLTAVLTTLTCITTLSQSPTIARWISLPEPLTDPAKQEPDHAFRNGNWTPVDVGPRLQYQKVYKTCPLLDQQDRCDDEQYERLLGWKWSGGDDTSLATLEETSYIEEDEQAASTEPTTDATEDQTKTLEEADSKNEEEKHKRTNRVERRSRRQLRFERRDSPVSIPPTAPKTRRLDPLHVLEKCLTNKTLGISGDSLSRQFFHALACTFHGHGAKLTITHVPDTKYLVQINVEHPKAKKNHARSGKPLRILWTGNQLNPYLMAYTASRPRPVISTTELHPSLMELVNHVKKDAKDGNAELDHLVLNTGLWLDPSSFQSDSKDFIQTYADTITSAIHSLNEAFSFKQNDGAASAGSTSSCTTKIWLRTSPFRHYRHGDYNTNGRCEAKRPQFPSSPLTYYYGAYAETMQNEILKDVLKAKTRISDIQAKSSNYASPVFDLLDITEISKAREDAHRSTKDCSHYCLPGVVDVWVDVWLRRIWDECVGNDRDH
ncbi:GDSL/SGNH-like acyl-esterase family found in Pmr5 and Cas1p-domain-containing protein [Fimicolochytrium jonesii]|uniref:GDSL/SGNH-like acyl-esterase family found in Pmr5 and Cas1p-domain-containing protein n=1 Tax=Fimicolochytrium jonesii TaxID=1396493 RepID=UPI0022FDF7E5|nr:GDSL/SGNH-like acyl-esterase family found in Pmr5 and Cas1p-domain-containing protein [Fimicolochytrium jonesii]KAI8822485.1 GDSL/SGNH-like acyl-esterase family found in Pmr5 and Cas1p-domain-containing protein [Fimicolochytrium jonesii]